MQTPNDADNKFTDPFAHIVFGERTTPSSISIEEGIKMMTPDRQQACFNALARSTQLLQELMAKIDTNVQASHDRVLELDIKLVLD